MTAVVTLRPDKPGRHYRLRTEADYAAVRRAQERVACMLDGWERGGKQEPYPVPDEPTPAGGGSGAGRAFSVRRYGMLQWGDLCTARQKAALATIARLLASELETAQSVSVALLVGRMSDFLVASARWKPDAECPVQALARPALPMLWDFAEASPWSDATGSVVSQANRMADPVESVCLSFQLHICSDLGF